MDRLLFTCRRFTTSIIAITPQKNTSHQLKRGRVTLPTEKPPQRSIILNWNICLYTSHVTFMEYGLPRRSVNTMTGSRTQPLMGRPVRGPGSPSWIDGWKKKAIETSERTTNPMGFGRSLGVGFLLLILTPFPVTSCLMKEILVTPKALRQKEVFHQNRTELVGFRFFSSTSVPRNRSRNEAFVGLRPRWRLHVSRWSSLEAEEAEEGRSDEVEGLCSKAVPYPTCRAPSSLPSLRKWG